MNIFSRLSLFTGEYCLSLPLHLSVKFYYFLPVYFIRFVWVVHSFGCNYE